MPGVQDRLEARARLAGVDLPAGLMPSLLGYYALLERWNRKINLTSLLDVDLAIDRLLLEPVAAAAHLSVNQRAHGWVETGRLVSCVDV